MKLNSDALYLSLMAQAFNKEVLPELHSSNAKAVAQVMRHCFDELLRRRWQTPAILEKANCAARELIAEGLSLMRGHPGDDLGYDEKSSDAATFEAKAAENEALTTRLAGLSRNLATASATPGLDADVQRFLRRTAEWEYQLHLELVQPTSKAKDLPTAEPISPEAFEAFLRTFDDRVRLHEFTRAEGGYGKQTYFANIEDASGQKRELVLRKADRVMSVQFGAFIVEREFHLLSKVAASGFPAPQPLWLGTDVSDIDGDFFVMERLPGRIPGSLLGGAENIPERYLLDLARLLARLHSMELETFRDYIDRYEAPSLLFENIEQCYRRSISEWRHHVAEVTQTPSPVMEYLFAWLADNVPKHAGRPVLVHGDFNIHNVLMSEEGRVSGVLDWECAMFGAPEQDFAYIKPHISRHIDWARFVAHYLDAGGRPLDEVSLDFYQAFSAMRVINGLQWFTKKLQSGESHELRLCMAELGFAAQFMGFALNQGKH